MTIAIAVKVHDGIVLAADSAVTLGQQFPDGRIAVASIYNNANKVCNLIKGLPVGAMFWGAASIGPASMVSVLKDLRQKMSANPPEIDTGWHVDRNSWQISNIAQLVKKFLKERLESVGNPTISGGVLISGHSSNSSLAESWLIETNLGAVQEPNHLYPTPEEAYWWANGEPEPLRRLLLGLPHGLVPGLCEGLARLGVQPELFPEYVNTLNDAIAKKSEVSVVHPAMPIQDAIHLADFLATTASLYSRFSPGPITVGGPIDIAAITKHEGFKWVRRKHYFEPRYNNG